MVDGQPRWRTGQVFAWFSDPAGNTLGVYQQPGLAETEAREAARP
jgi:hypothetical protein